MGVDTLLADANPDLNLPTFVYAWRSEHRSERTLGEYLAWIARLETHLPGGLARVDSPGESRDDIALYLSRLSVDQAAYALRAIRAWAKRTGRPDPAAGLKAPAPILRAQPTATTAQICAVLAQPHSESKDVRAAATVATLWSTGMRASELHALTWDDIDLDNGTALIRTSKTRTSRVVGLDQRAIHWLRTWRTSHRDEGLVFPGCRRTIGRDVTRLTGLSPHALRRGLAVHWLRSGGSQASLQALAGWTTGAMVTRYVAALASETAIEEHRRILASV